MLGKFDDAFFLKRGEFGEHAVQAAAECRGLQCWAGVASSPALEEAARHLVTGFDAGDTRTDLDHLTGAVRKWNKIVAHRRAISAARNQEVAIIQRTRGDLDQHLPVQRFRYWPV